MAAPPPPPSILLRNPAAKTLSVLSVSPVSLCSTHPSFHFTLPIKSSKSLHCSSRPLFDAVSDLRDEEDDEEEVSIGDCLVFEEGIFNDPFLQDTFSPRNGAIATTKLSRGKKSTRQKEVEPEYLIPEKWLEVQKELNITKKERRKLSQQLEFGRKVEKRREALKPLQEEYERFKKEKIQQLKPLVLDDPEPRYLKERNKSYSDDKDDGARNGEVVRGRVAPRNPRLAVYGVGLDDISEHFNSGNYDPAAADKSQGPRKLFSKEEKIQMNRRVPDLSVSTSGKWHPLHTLAASGEFYLVNSLLKHNLDINSSDKDGLTAIHKAILGKKQAIFNFLLRESANPFVRDKDGATLMHYAVATASSQMIKILLLYNVDVNLQDHDGWTPLHLAVQSRRTDIVRLLLIKGANKTLKNQDGLTPLDLCLYSGRDTRMYELIKLMKRFA